MKKYTGETCEKCGKEIVQRDNAAYKPNLCKQCACKGRTDASKCK